MKTSVTASENGLNNFLVFLIQIRIIKYNLNLERFRIITKKDLYKRSIIEDMKQRNWSYQFLMQAVIFVSLGLKIIFKPENETIYGTNDYLWH